MSDEYPNSIPQGDPPVPEDIVPASQVPSDPESDLCQESRPAPESFTPGRPDVPSEPISQPGDVPRSAPPRRQSGNEIWSLLVAAAAWIIPGAGYLLQRRWARAVVGFAAVAALAVIGLKMRGNIFPPHGTEPFDFLGFIADAGSGIFYFFAKNVEAAGPDVSRAAGDYGTRLFATAGILNFLLVLDAVEIARGEKA